jgi:hypothetical protein
MNRQEKIEALALKHFGLRTYESGNFHTDLSIAGFKAGLLAGIALRDEELLAMEFDGSAFDRFMVSFYERDKDPKPAEVARWQHEQFMKAIKGDGDGYWRIKKSANVVKGYQS